MTKRQTQMWVDPDFARIIKINARIEGLKIVDYTKNLGNNFEELTQKKVEVDKTTGEIIMRFKIPV